MNTTGALVVPAATIRAPAISDQRHVARRDGLAMTVASGIVEAHGGSLQYAGDPHLGMTFTLELPLAPARSVMRPGAMDQSHEDMRLAS